MIASRGRGMHIRNTAYIPSNCKNICITDINESGERAVLNRIKILEANDER